MYFFYYSYMYVCVYVYVYFFCRFFKIGDKKTQWATYTPAGRGGGGVQYCQMGYI